MFTLVLVCIGILIVGYQAAVSRKRYGRIPRRIKFMLMFASIVLIIATTMYVVSPYRLL